jgi:hypothetical protein
MKAEGTVGAPTCLFAKNADFEIGFPHLDFIGVSTQVSCWNICVIKLN